jgi:hypothetical protein
MKKQKPSTPPKLIERVASDYIRAAVAVGVSYESATREEANELDREVDVLTSQLSKIIWSGGDVALGKRKEG